VGLNKSAQIRQRIKRALPITFKLVMLVEDFHPHLVPEEFYALATRTEQPDPYGSNVKSLETHPHAAVLFVANKQP
jgi:hypothetical protein